MQPHTQDPNSGYLLFDRQENGRWLPKYLINGRSVTYDDGGLLQQIIEEQASTALGTNPTSPRSPSRRLWDESMAEATRLARSIQETINSRVNRRWSQIIPGTPFVPVTSTNPTQSYTIPSRLSTVLNTIQQRPLTDEEMEAGGTDADHHCKICFSNMQNVRLLPCRHTEACKDCLNVMFPSQRKTTCPICRGAVISVELYNPFPVIDGGGSAAAATGGSEPMRALQTPVGRARKVSENMACPKCAKVFTVGGGSYTKHVRKCTA
jgi:RNA polymerase subunit RPABC4/transcription elongation factor Spt4